MIGLNDGQKAEFYYRSFMAVDGLWFVKTEAELGFEKALEIDVEVWKVLPRIQARVLKSMLGADLSADTFFDYYTTRMELERFTFAAEKNSGGFTVEVSGCPGMIPLSIPAGDTLQKR